MLKIRSCCPLITLPLLALLAAVACLSWEQLSNICPQGGDYGLIALAVERAKDFNMLTGPYSRFGFNHPLPTYFYLYAALEPLMGHAQYWMGKYQSSSLLINSLCFATAIGLFYRSSNSAVLTLLLLWGVTLAFTRTYWIGSWGPSTLPVPLLLLMVALAAWRSGGGASRQACFSSPTLLPIAVGAILLASNHLSGAALALGLGAYTLLHWALFGPPGPAAAPRRLAYWPAWLALTLFVAALLPLVADLGINRGTANPVLIWDYLSAKRDTSGWREAAAVGSQYFWPKHFTPPYPQALFVFAWLLILSAYRGFSPFLRVLTQLSAVLIIGVIALARSLEGQAFSYLFNIAAVLTPLTLTLLAAGIASLAAQLWPTVRPTVRPQDPATGMGFGKWFWAVAAALVVALSAGQIYQRSFPAQECKLHSTVIAAVDQHFSAAASYYIKVHHHDSWGTTALLLHELYRRRIPFGLEPHYGFLFGSRFVSAPPPDSPVLHVTRSKMAPALPTARHFRLRHELYWFDDS